MSQEEAGTLRSSDKVQLFPYAGQLTDETCDAVADSLSGPVYVSVDLDVLDPSLMAAVGTPEPGGLGWYPLLRLLRLVAERHPIVGFDVVELAPREGPPSCAYMAAKLVYKLIGYSRGV
jgi:agmatinase